MKTTWRNLGGHHACSVRRRVGLEVKEATNPMMNKGAICRNILHGLLVDPVAFLTWEDAKAYVNDIFDKATDFTHEAEADAMKEEILLTCKRFVDWVKAQEWELPLTRPGMRDVCLGGVLDVSVCPDWVRMIEPEKEGDLPQVEVAMITSSKVSMSYAGRSDDTCIHDSLKLYALMEFGKIYLPDGGIVIGSIYYLKAKEKDPEYRLPYSEKFVATASLEYNKDTGVSKFEKRYLASLHRFMEGKSCTKTQCEACEFHRLCYYVKPPVALPKVKAAGRTSEYRFTTEQMKVIAFDKGYGRANCGAGSGKTTVVVQNVVAKLLKGVDPKTILLITYTNNGCKEMRERLSVELQAMGIDDVNTDDIKITTFHGLGDEIIQKHWRELGYSKKPILADKIDKIDLIVDILGSRPELAGFDYKYPFMDMPNHKGVYQDVLKLFSEMKANGINSLRELVKTYPELEGSGEVILEAYKEYLDRMKKESLLDYTDQEEAIFSMLRKNMFFLSEDYELAHIIVDEFQDSNPVQMQIIKALCDTDYFESLLVVGDDSQSIFGFRGTTPENIINFPKIIGEKVEDFFLVDNYRSTPEILAVANFINNKNAHRIRKNLISQKSSGRKPLLAEFETDGSELLWIATQIETKIKSGVAPGDIAYIARTKAELGRMQTELTKRGIVSMLDVPEPLLGNSRVAAAIELARLFQEPDATKSLMVYLDAVMDNGFLNIEPDAAEKLLNVNADAFTKIIYAMTEEEKVKYFLQLLNVLNNGDELYESFLENLKCRSGSVLKPLLDYIIKFERYKSDLEARHTGNFEAVKLTTAHSSKGMEWKYVFVSLTKFDRTGTTEDLEEIRRLIFVAFTRAKEELTVSASSGRKFTNVYFSECYLCDGFEYQEL